MKVTKVDKRRLAIGKIEADGKPKKIFYISPYKELKQKNLAAGDVVKMRAENANKLYNVFFGSGGATKEFRKAFTELIKELVGLSGKTSYGAEYNVMEAYTFQIKKKQSKSAQRTQAFTGQAEELKSDNTKLKKIDSIPYGNGTYGFASTLDEFDKMLNSNMKDMRKALKRGENYNVARQLMIGFALAGRDVEYEEVNYKEIEFKDIARELDYKSDSDKGRSRLRNFLDAVNRDYYKTNVVKSINGMNTKVQPRKSDDDGKEIKLPGSSQKSSSLNKNEAVNNILIDYAKSSEDSDKTLLRIKGLVFDYFLPNEDNSEFLKTDNLWKMPKRTEDYFDNGFEPVETNRTEKFGKNIKLSDLFSDDKLDSKKVRKRINYVNYGKYIAALKKIQEKYGESKENKKDRNIDLFWTNYIKEYVEKHYVATDDNNSELSKEKCYAIDMMFECWKEAIRFICGKYIDIGKGIYHFTNMPTSGEEYSEGTQYGMVKKEYNNGITSFDYEAIKAEDDLKRDISVYMVSAAAAFSRSVIDDNKRQELVKKSQDENPGEKVDEMEDIFFLKDKKAIKKPDGVARKQLLRFYGGQSSFEKLDEIDEDKLIDELLSHLKSIRNENFHFTKGKDTKTTFDITKILYENDKKALKALVKQRYYANNVTQFYDGKKFFETVENLYAEEKVVAAQVPAFRKVWKRETLPGYIDEKINTNDIKEDRAIYEGALYFLLKEIYYRDFVVNESAAKKHFTDAVDEYVYKRNEELDKAKKESYNPKDKNKARKLLNEAKQLTNAANNFSAYVRTLKGYSFGQICQAIMQEYSQQNSKSDGVEIYQHFKMIFPICVKMAFCNYLDDNKNYVFIKKPSLQKGERWHYSLDGVAIGISENKEFDEETGEWYTFAHFLHPRQLNHLIGSFKNYVQYKEDIVRRKKYAGQDDDANQVNNETVENAKKILEILDFVRCVSGRVSNTYEDYYESKDEYADYLAKYIDYKKIDGKTSFESFSKFCSDNEFYIYADKENPKVLRNVEIARMYAGGDVEIGKYKKITKEEIADYYKEYAKVDENNREMVAKRQKEKNRITLNDITDIFSLINDLLGELVSLSYLKERDEMYLLLGFYSMAMKNEEGWGEELKKFKDDEIVGDGLVLCQVCSLFDFGLNLLRRDDKGRIIESTGAKMIHFAGREEREGVKKIIGIHEMSWKKALQIFERDEYMEQSIELRNYVDHMKYYAKQDKSIVSLYSDYYTKMFAYNTKLRKSVLYNFKSILEKYFIVGDVEFDNDRKNIKLKESLESTEFTYKKVETEKGGNKKGNAKNGEVKVDARSKDFLENVQEILNYQRKQ